MLLDILKDELNIDLIKYQNMINNNYPVTIEVILGVDLYFVVE